MDELPLSEIQLDVSRLILATPPPGKHSARSAISHIKRGWSLRRIDPEMAVFRAITGEEESATALFHALKRLKYEGAERLNPRNHVHKSALQPFLAAVENNFHAAKMDQFEPAVELDLKEENPKFKTRITLTLESGEKVLAYPVPPLNFSVNQNGRAHNFAEELLQVTKQKTIEDVVAHVRHLANRRNQVLYASQQGVPKIENLSEKFFLERRDRIFRNLVLYLHIDPYPIQLFVQQALSAFLEMLGLLPRDLESETG